MEIQNLRDKSFDFDQKNNRPLSNIHISLKQRNGRKTITFIEGLATDLDLKKIVRALKKSFQTNGAIIDNKEGGKILQLNGDHRENVKNFFIKYKIWDEPDLPIKIHGF
jgi:translation initiation factor 1